MSFAAVYDFLGYSAAAALFLTALLVLRRWPAQAVAIAYLFAAATLAALCLGLTGDRASAALGSGAWTYWPVAAWWLAGTYGRRSHRRTSAGVALAILPVTLLGIYLAGPLFPAGPGGPLEATAWGRWVALAGVGFWLAAVVNFLLTVRGAVGQPRLRRSAALCAFACLLPLWPETVTAFTGSLPRYGVGLAAALATVAYLVAGEWLLRHRGREEDLQFEHRVAYVSIAVFLLGLYLLLVGGVGKVVEWLGGDLRAFLSALGGVLLAVAGLALATSGRVWERIRNYVDRNLYRGEFDFRADWIRISEELAALPDPRDLGATLSRILALRMRCDTVLLYRRDEQGTLELWSRQGGAVAPPEQLAPEGRWIDWLWRLGAPADWNSIDADDAPSALTSQTRLVLPLIAKQEIVALACLGRPDDPFTAEERLWLETAGQQAALAVMAANLTERLIATRELASFHRMSSFVIHDVKNAVSMLSLLLQNLETRKGELLGGRAEATLRQATDKLTALVGRFAGARGELRLSRRRFRVDLLLEELATKVGPSFPQVQIGTHCPPGLEYHGDPDQIARILENVFINACEAMQGAGAIAATVTAAPGEIRIDVADTGPGMDVDFIRERLFRPFATTKKKGLGIGLYQSREIARAHGGTLVARSTPNQGTTFTLTLPAVQPTA